MLTFNATVAGAVCTAAWSVRNTPPTEVVSKGNAHAFPLKKPSKSGQSDDNETTHYTRT